MKDNLFFTPHSFTHFSRSAECGNVAGLTAYQYPNLELMRREKLAGVNSGTSQACCKCGKKVGDCEKR